MAVEIEAKMKVADFQEITAKLNELGASFVGDHLETNTFFDTDDRSLLAQDQGLRLRRNRHLQSGTEELILTFKGPRQHGALKSRTEIELTVGNAENAAALFSQLGYHIVLSFEKKRQSWKLEDCKIELDQLPHIGSFIEVEGPSEQSVMRVRQMLGLETRPIIKASYIAMLMAHLQEQGQRERDIRF